jgi:carbamoyltransferase
MADNYVLGINTVYHEPAACLMKNGIVVAAAEEERFTRIRHGKEANPFSSWILPFHAINWCFSKEGITINEIDHVAFSFKPSIRLNKNISKYLKLLLTHKMSGIKKELIFGYFNSKLPMILQLYPPKWHEIKKRFIFKNNITKFHNVEHHLAHAASGFFCSSFKESAILSIDGIGEVATTLLAYGKNNQIKKVKEFYYPHSLGFFYEEITVFLGFQKNHDEFKVMGMAGYGKPTYYNQMKKLIKLKSNGGYEIKSLASKKLKNLFGEPRQYGTEITQRHKDIAASAQKVLEDTVLYMLDWLQTKTKSENLCITGGVGLNCLLNQKIVNQSKFKNIFIQPAANDAGTAMGAALYCYNYILGNKRNYSLKNAYLGPEFSNEEIKLRLNQRKIKYQYSENIAKECAKFISKGKVIGWFQGRMEWGPRALGNRSILADPRKKNMKDIINDIKGREDFRPLAPAIIEEKLSEYFEESKPSPFMLITYNIKKEKLDQIPAVVHVDKTARVQTVNKNDNPKFYELIKQFEKITKIPVVINTSLNYAGKPIVCNIEDALNCFYNSGIDILAINNFLIFKEKKK